MIRVSTKLGPSHGIGVFADMDIPAGQTVWQLDERVDRVYEDLDWAEEPLRSFLFTYTYRDPTRHVYVLCGDDARFVNHSDTPNVRPVHEAGLYVRDVAIRDIRRGDELTIDYRLIHDGKLSFLEAP